MKETNLSSMPNEIIWHILNFSDPKSLLKIYQTNKKLLAILSDSAWWQQYYLQKFPQLIQSLPFGDFISSIQNDTLAKAERKIIVKIVGSEEAKWPNLEVFFNYIKEEKENQLPKNYFDGFKNRVIVTLNKYLVCKNQQVSSKDYYKSITILPSLEQQLREYLAFISCLYLFHSDNFVGAIELIMGKNLDKMLTGNDLVLLGAYTNDLLIRHLFSEISNPKFLNLLNKLTVSDWSTLINNHPTYSLTCLLLVEEITAGVLTPDLDKATIDTLVYHVDNSHRKVLFNHPKYSTLVDKEFMQSINNPISIYQKKEKEETEKANCLKAETTKLKFCSGKEETEQDQSKINAILASQVAEKDKKIAEQQGLILELQKTLAKMNNKYNKLKGNHTTLKKEHLVLENNYTSLKKGHLVLENKVNELTNMVERAAQFFQSQQVNNKNEQNISIQNKENATSLALNKGTLGNSLLSSLSTLFGMSAKKNNKVDTINESQKKLEVNTGKVKARLT
jgi:hypothetical protein